MSERSQWLREHAEATYARGMARVASEPEPIGQKFPRGSKVRIATDLGPFMSHFRSGEDATVEYTYAHAYEGNDVNLYCLRFTDGNTGAWYRGEHLQAICEGENS